MDLGPVHYSTNYVWLKNDVIAKGSKSTIYRAKHYLNGAMVALKWYEIEKNVSEIEELRKLDHKNLVQIFDVEKESTTDQVVVAMEICTDGTLENILRHRKNAFGFEENEFLLLLGNLAEGLNYLRRNYGGFIDVRPGNIMRTTKPNGVSLYKIIDYEAKYFDKSADMDEVNLDGIADYYDRVCKKDNSRNPDLFSVGAILYHAASGTVPFKCPNARRDVMIRMLTQKKREYISGRQYYENGRFEYTQALPVSTPLNPTLQKLVVSLLVYIMDTEESPGPRFEKYVAMCESITSKIKVRIFIVNLVKEYVFHLDDTYNLRDIRVLIETEIQFNPDDYLLFYEDKVLTKAQLADIKTEKRTNVIHEFTVFDTSDHCPIDEYVRIFKPDCCDFKYTNLRAAEESCLKDIYRVAYESLDFISEKTPICEWFNKSVQQFCAFLSNEVIVLEIELKRLRTAKIFIDQTEEFRKIVEYVTQIKYDLILEIKSEIEKVIITDLEPIILNQNKLLTDWRESSTELMKTCLTQPIIEAKVYLSYIDKAVARIRQMNIDDFHSNQIHAAEQKHILKMKDNMVELAQVVDKDFKKLMDFYTEWHMKAQNIYIYIKKLKNQIDDYTNKLVFYRNEVKKEVKLKDLRQLVVKKNSDEKDKDFESDLEVVHHSDVKECKP